MPLHATARARLLVLLIVLVAITGVAIAWWASGRSSFAPPTANVNRNEQLTGSASETPSSPAQVSSTPDTSSIASPALSATISPPQSPGTPTAEDSAGNQASSKDAPLQGNFVGTLKLVIPVVGVRPDQLVDTFTASRSEGRIHDAIDIPAPAGTAVLAAADGEIARLFQSERGGTTIYQLSPDKKLVFYYAHLQGYADGLVAGKFVKQGEVIGYVGDTGNAGAGNFHLHFSISVITDPKRYWEGTNINPYPLLRK